MEKILNLLSLTPAEREAFLAAAPGACQRFAAAGDLDAAGYAGAVRSINIAYTVGVLVFGPMPGILAPRPVPAFPSPGGMEKRMPDGCTA